MEYKIETHLHTSQASACAVSTGAEMAVAHKQKGYDGIIITDHFFNGNTAIDRKLPWEERVELFCKGYEDAKAEGDKIGLDVYFGWEYGGDEGMEFLTYGLDKEWLLAHPTLMLMPIEEYLKLVRNEGAFVSQAHPFREAPYIPRTKLYPNLTEAVEVFNAGNARNEFNEKALKYAEEYGLLQTCGSDGHIASQLRGYGMLIDHKINSIQEFISAIREGRTKLITTP